MTGNFTIESDFSGFTKVFLEENSKHNLISHNDEQFLYEKHIYDSLAIKLFFEKHGNNFKNVLDIGCGGGFPCVPIAIEYPQLKVTGIDSIRKKIHCIENIKNSLGITNLTLICERVENIKNQKFNLIVSRAVGDLSKLIDYAYPLMADNGYFIAYKSKKADDEIQKADLKLKKLNLKLNDIIEYSISTNQVYERKLICIKK